MAHPHHAHTYKMHASACAWFACSCDPHTDFPTSNEKPKQREYSSCDPPGADGSQQGPRTAEEACHNTLWICVVLTHREDRILSVCILQAGCMPSMLTNCHAPCLSRSSPCTMQRIHNLLMACCWAGEAEDGHAMLCESNSRSSELHSTRAPPVALLSLRRLICIIAACLRRACGLGPML